MIYKVYKRLGETTLSALERFKKENELSGKFTFAGRLDPMAKGLFLALSGKDIKRKDKINSLDKQYKLRVIFGVSTDSQDLLGLIKECSLSKEMCSEDLRQSIRSLQAKREWSYPCFSSKTHNGKQLFKYSLEGNCPDDRPKYMAQIYKIELIEQGCLDAYELQHEIKRQLKRLQQSSVKESYKNFRRDDVLESWRDFFCENKSANFQYADLKVISSKSLYMRDLAEELGKEMSLPAFAMDIERLAFGTYVKFYCNFSVFWRKY